MRPLATWLVVGGLAVLGLAAARDALRRDSAATTQTGATPRASSGAAESPPAIPGRPSVAAELRAGGVRGRLYFTDGRCRLRALRLPSLEWIKREGGTAADCRFALSPDATGVLFGRAAWAPDGRLAAVETPTVSGSGNEIRVFSRAYGWGAVYLGRSPAFKPDGTLTYSRAGDVDEWTAACPRGTPTVAFGGRSALPRCRRLALSKRVAGPISEAAWLDDRTMAAIAYGRLVVVSHGRVRATFGPPHAGLENVEASADGRWISVRLGRQLLLFDRRLDLDLTHAGVGQIDALDWSPDGRWVVAATNVNIWFFRPGEQGDPAIRLPLTAVDVAWR